VSYELLYRYRFTFHQHLCRCHWQENRKVFSKKFPNQLDTIIQALEPFRSAVAGVVVESTYNWYWLVDGLKEKGYRVHLANPSAIKQYEGLKHADDVTDAFHLANVLRLGILPEGYIYPQAERPVRDLLRKRLHLVQQRTAQILSIQNLLTRNLALRMTAAEVKKLNVWDAGNCLPSATWSYQPQASIGNIGFLGARIKELGEGSNTHSAGTLNVTYHLLQTVPGIGVILALTIMYETERSSRFARVGQLCILFAAVSRARACPMVKVKALAIDKNGNRHLFLGVCGGSKHRGGGIMAMLKSYYQRKGGTHQYRGGDQGRCPQKTGTRLLSDYIQQQAFESPTCLLRT